MRKRTTAIKPFDPTNPWEIQEGYALAGYLLYLQRQGKIQVYSHLPHEQYTEHRSIKRKNKLQGVRAGVPDYVIVIKEFVIFLELKRIKGGVVSIDQKEWLHALDNKTTVTTVANGFEQAKQFIDTIIQRG